MSEKAETAQKWAEAKAALEAADQAYAAAKEAYSKAEDAEFHAWQALEALAGRVSVIEPPQAPVFEHAKDVSPTYRTNLSHNLKVDPIG